jgi:hypothetical protein
MCEQEHEIVQPQVDHKTNWLTQLALHNCKRYQNPLITNSQFTLSEIVSITTLNFTLSTQEPDWTTFFPKFESLEPKDQNLLRPKRYSGFGVHLGILNEATNLANVKNLVAMQTSTTTTTPSTTAPYKYPYTLSFEKHWFIPDSAYEYLYYAVQPNTITKTIPDLVNILHAFWRIQRVKKFNKLDFQPSTDFKEISSQLLQKSKTKLLVETSMTQTSSTSSTTSTSSLKPTSKPTKTNFLMTNFLLKAFDLKYLTPPQLTMTLTKDLRFYQSLQQQPSDQLPEPGWRL